MILNVNVPSARKCPVRKIFDTDLCQNYDDYTLLWELFIYYFMHYDLVWFLICDL